MGHFFMKFLFSIALLLFFISFGSSCKQEKTESEKTIQSSPVDVLSVKTVLATISDEESPTETDPVVENRPVFNVIFNEKGRGVAYVAKIADKYHVVFNGKVSIPISGLDYIKISPDGMRIAFAAMVDGSWRMVTDNEPGRGFDGVGEPVFSPDSRHLAYEARSGEKSHIIVDGSVISGPQHYLSTPLFSHDGKKIAYLEAQSDDSKKEFVIYELETKMRFTRDSIVSSIVSNEDSTRVSAVAELGGKQRVVVYNFDRPEAEDAGPLYGSVSDIAFGSDGISTAYIVQKNNERFFVLNGKAEPLPDSDFMLPFAIRPDNEGLGIAVGREGGVYLHQAFSKTDVEKVRYDEIRNITFSRNSRLHAYAARKKEKWFVVVNGKEGPYYDFVVSPAFSFDGKHIVYRVRDKGNRFVVVAEGAGSVINEHQSYEMVFQPVFTSDGKSVAYGVKDGNELIWKVEKL